MKMTSGQGESQNVLQPKDDLLIKLLWPKNFHKSYLKLPKISFWTLNILLEKNHLDIFYFYFFKIIFTHETQKQPQEQQRWKFLLIDGLISKVTSQVFHSLPWHYSLLPSHFMMTCIAPFEGAMPDICDIPKKCCIRDCRDVAPFSTNIHCTLREFRLKCNLMKPH